MTQLARCCRHFIRSIIKQSTIAVATVAAALGASAHAAVYTFTLSGPVTFILRDAPPSPDHPAFDLGTLTFRGNIDWTAFSNGVLPFSGFGSAGPDAYAGRLNFSDASVEATGNRPGVFTLQGGGLWFTLVGDSTNFEYDAGSYASYFTTPSSSLPPTWMASLEGDRWVVKPAPTPFSITATSLNTSANIVAAGPVGNFIWTGPFTFSVSPIPEPGAPMLFGSGLLMLFAVRRKVVRPA